MGFCLFNNVPVAINAVRKQHKNNENLKILVVDWDVHHGNGTQNMFYDDPNVLYFSTHRGYYFYPMTGKMKEVGGKIKKKKKSQKGNRWTQLLFADV